MWKLGLDGEWFWCLRISSTSVPDEMLCSYRPDGLFSCRCCSLSYRGQVDAWGRPHGEGSWADEFIYGDCLQGIWVEGELLGKFESRETGTNAAFNQLPLDRLWTPCLRHFDRTRETRWLAETWNSQNFLATPTHGLGVPTWGSQSRPRALRHILAERTSRRRASSLRWLYPTVFHAQPGHP